MARNLIAHCDVIWFNLDSKVCHGAVYLLPQQEIFSHYHYFMGCPANSTLKYIHYNIAYMLDVFVSCAYSIIVTWREEVIELEAYYKRMILSPCKAELLTRVDS